MPTQLSPLTLSNMGRTSHGWLTRHENTNDKPRKRLDPVYLCPECGEQYDWEDDALQCCEEEGDALQSEVPQTHCPVCDTKHEDSYLAANCCLWKDTTPHQRFLIASRLELDPRTTWQEAIEYAMSRPQPT